MNSLFWDTNKQATRRLAAIFYYNEDLLLHVVKAQLPHASSYSPE